MNDHEYALVEAGQIIGTTTRYTAEEWRRLADKARLTRGNKQLIRLIAEFRERILREARQQDTDSPAQG